MQPAREVWVSMEVFLCPLVACFGARLLAGPWFGLFWFGCLGLGGGIVGLAACLLACLLACLPSEASIVNTGKKLTIVVATAVMTAEATSIVAM